MPFFAFFWKACSTYHSGKTHGVNGPVGIAVEIINQLQDSAAAESFQRLRRDRFITVLNLAQSVTHAVLHLGRESLQVFKAGANKNAWLRFGPFGAHFCII